MKHILTAVLAACIWAGVPACNPLSIDVEGQNPWTHLDIKNRPADLQLAVVGDRTGLRRAGVFRHAMTRINLLQPAFVMSVGDLVDGYTEDPVKLDEERLEFSQIVGSLDMPFFYTAGNHDIYNELSEDHWESRLGRSYYHFIYHDVLFIVLNSEDPPTRSGHIGKEQLAYVKQLLTKHSDPRWTFMFLHKPLWRYGAESNWSDMEEILGDRSRVTFFAGHHHSCAKTARNGRTFYRLATTGGGSELTGPEDGCFDHVMWVTMAGDKPIVANLMLDGIWTDDPVVEARHRLKSPYPKVADGGVYARVLRVGSEYRNVNAGIPEQMLSSLGISLGSRLLVKYGDKQFEVQMGKDYSDVPEGQWIALVNDVGNLQIAISFGHAAEALGCKVGDVVFVKPVERAEP